MTNKVKNITIISILIAFAIVLSAFDTYISSAVFGFFKSVIPGIKIGLANIVILLFVYRFNFFEGLLACSLKSIVVALLFSGWLSFSIGFPGTILSFLLMSLLHMVFKTNKSMIFVSLMGAVTHIIGQIIFAFIFYGIDRIETFLLYSPFLIIISAISGVIMGLISSRAVILLDKNNIVKE